MDKGYTASDNYYMQLPVLEETDLKYYHSNLVFDNSEHDYFEVRCLWSKITLISVVLI